MMIGHAGDDDVSLDAAIRILTDGKLPSESAEKKSAKRSTGNAGI